jgi:adenylosuccinate synthase
VTEDPELAARLSEPHNGTNAWQERFRRGHLDLVAARYALEVAGGVDALVVTHLDALRTFDRARAAVAYRPALDLDPALVAGVADVCGGSITRLRPCWERNLAYQEQLTALAARSAPMYVDVGRGTDDEAFLSALEVALHAPIALTSYGPGPDDRRRHASLGRLLC